MLRSAITFTFTITFTLTAFAVDFTRDIRPILAEKCTSCHGGVKQKGGLSFLSRSSVLAKLKSDNHAVVPGDTQAGTLLERVTTDDPDERMPPEGKPLTDTEVKLLEAWIASGAEWPEHRWFQPPVQPVIPKLDSKWPTNAIDAFVLDRLNKANIAPSPETDPTTLLRRLSLDLTGLPPTVEEIDAFLANKAADRYEQLVDRLLDSPHFGERWGRHWLDHARYADSDGYEKDNARRGAWRWRNWVIDSINADMPYDQFTREQLAGDLLPNASTTQQLATAFHRQTLFNREGGVDPEEDRTKRLIDRTNTTAGVWLGLTVGCTQCHNHPYDPLSQKEFYALYAFFNNTDEASIKVTRSGSSEEKRLRAEIAKAEADGGERFAVWLKKQTAAAGKSEPVKHHAVTLGNVHSKGGQTMTKNAEGVVAVSGKLPKSDTYTVDLSLPAGKYTGIHLQTLAHKSLPGNGPGRVKHGNFVLNTFSAAIVAADGKETPISFTSATATFSQDKWDVKGAIDSDAKSGWAISPQRGKTHEASFWVSGGFSIGQANTVRVTMAHAYGKDHFIGRFKLAALTGTPSKSAIPGNLRKLLTKGERSDSETAQLRDHFNKTADPVTSAARKKLTDFLRKNAFDARVLRERGTPRETYVFHRGDFLQPAKDKGKVQPGVPAVLPPLTPRDAKKGADRLDFVNWLLAPENPLTARVAVNDVWMHLFGQPLTTPVDDWGTRAVDPPHPDLVDWLALEYRRLDWSRKKLIKTIVMSSTYRQASVHRPELAEVDPDNRLLHRQNRMRVEGELVRDVFLAASGLLSRKLGGPSVFPPIPADVAKQSYANNFKWTLSKGEDRYRRGMYTFFKRTAPDPNLMTFDCPDSNVTTAARGASNTPLQALATLQNPVFHEAAQALAAKVLTTPGNDAARLSIAFRRCTARLPQPAEAARLKALLDSNRNAFKADPAAAKQLAAAHLLNGVDAVEAAAWIATTRIILNLDETITRE
jgi:hypothetical protein